jgi:hypothetical protein
MLAVFGVLFRPLLSPELRPASLFQAPACVIGVERRSLSSTSCLPSPVRPQFHGIPLTACALAVLGQGAWEHFQTVASASSLLAPHREVLLAVFRVRLTAVTPPRLSRALLGGDSRPVRVVVEPAVPPPFLGIDLPLRTRQGPLHGRSGQDSTRVRFWEW